MSTTTIRLSPAQRSALRSAIRQHLRDRGMPPDTFAEFGVDAVRGLPARVFREGEALTVGGIATDPQATHVHLLMLPPEGGMALGVWSLAIATDRSFAGEVAPGDLGLGRYAWALAAGAIDSARVTRSVRCVVVAADEDVAGP